MISERFSGETVSVLGGIMLMRLKFQSARLKTEIFAKANRALTAEQTLERLSRLRSVSPYSISNILQKHSEIRSFGFGYFGLKNWDGLHKEVILRDRGAIERAVRRATPPLSFATLSKGESKPLQYEDIVVAAFHQAAANFSQAIFGRRNSGVFRQDAEG